MFCLTFLMFKLIFVPLFRLIERRIFQCIRIKPHNIAEEEMEDVSEVNSTTLPSSLENRITQIRFAQAMRQQSAWD